MKKGVILAVGVWFSLTAICSTAHTASQNNSPQVIAHRGGKANWPENTICAFRHNIARGVAAIEMDVQVTQDGEVVVYHPDDLWVWTTSKGAVATKVAKNIVGLDTTSKYKGPDAYKTQCNPDELGIPKLEDVLAIIPTKTPIIIDMKSLPAKDLVTALIKTIPDDQWKRLLFYSTNAEHTKLLRERKPDALIFEDRGATFSRNLKMITSHECTLKTPQKWVGYELIRTMDVCDKTKLGKTCVENLAFTVWTPDTIRCTRHMTGAKIVFFGINTPADFTAARRLGANAVFSDDPEALLPAKHRKK